MMSSQNAPNIPRWAKAFPYLFLSAWACAAALVKWESPWLYGLAGASVVVALWVGRRQPMVLRGLLVLALAFPIWKRVDRRHGAVASVDDAAVIRALVGAEETYLSLVPKTNALSK